MQIQRYRASNEVMQSKYTVHDGIMIIYYPGLPHIDFTVHVCIYCGARDEVIVGL